MGALPVYRRVAEESPHGEGSIADNDMIDDRDVIFVEVTVTDASDFETELHLRGEVLHLRDSTGRRPHIYFEWTEGNPAANVVRYLAFGQGEVAPVTREMLRRAEPDGARRPHVHVG